MHGTHALYLAAMALKRGTEQRVLLNMGVLIVLGMTLRTKHAAQIPAQVMLIYAS